MKLIFLGTPDSGTYEEKPWNFDNYIVIDDVLIDSMISINPIAYIRQVISTFSFK